MILGRKGGGGEPCKISRIFSELCVFFFVKYFIKFFIRLIFCRNTDSATGTSNRDDSNRRRPSRTPMMATVMGAVLHAQIRLIPFMRLLRQYLLQDTTFGPDVSVAKTS